MTFLLANWRSIIYGLLIVVFLAYVYREGGATPRAELRALQGQIKAQAAQDKKDRERADSDYQIRISALERDYADLLRKYNAKPKPVIARVCEDQPGNEAVAAAVGRYIERMAGVRERVAELARHAATQEQALECVRNWAN